ncbi:hypothetical protein FF1_024459 [Malus domestica]
MFLISDIVTDEREASYSLVDLSGSQIPIIVHSNVLWPKPRRKARETLKIERGNPGPVRLQAITRALATAMSFFTAYPSPESTAISSFTSSSSFRERCSNSRELEDLQREELAEEDDERGSGLFDGWEGGEERDEVVGKERR